MAAHGNTQIVSNYMLIPGSGCTLGLDARKAVSVFRLRQSRCRLRESRQRYLPNHDDADKNDDDSRRAGLQSVATASDPLRPAGRGPHHDVEKPNAAHWQAKEESEREIPAEVNAPWQPQSSGAQVGNGEQHPDQDRIDQSPKAGAGIRQMHRPEHHREDCDRADCSDALFQVLKGIAAKYQFFYQCPEEKNEQYGPDPRQSVHTEAKPGAGMPPNRDRNNRQDRQHESDEAADGELDRKSV